MTALLAKALMVATIAWSPCPTTDYTTSCTIGEHVYMAPGEAGWFKHELGHVFDAAYLTNADRGTFEYLAHLHQPWLGNTNPPVEQFAEAFRYCAHSTRFPPRIVYFTYDPTVRQHRRMCAWLATLADRPPQNANEPAEAGS
jgi:hypothetical protein